MSGFGINLIRDGITVIKDGITVINDMFPPLQNITFLKVEFFANGIISFRLGK